jgi:hypothetical protein
MPQTHNCLNIFTLGGEAQRHRGLYEKQYMLRPALYELGGESAAWAIRTMAMARESNRGLIGAQRGSCQADMHLFRRYAGGA